MIKGGQNWILSRVEKIVLDEKNKLLFIRPKTDNSFSTYRLSKLRRSENGPETNSKQEHDFVPSDVRHKNLDTEHTDTQTSDSHTYQHISHISTHAPGELTQRSIKRRIASQLSVY